MVKRLLSVAFVAFFMMLSLQAQLLQRDPSRHIISRLSQPMRAPQKVASLDGTTAFGYGNSGTWSGLGVGSTGVAFDVAIFLPGDVFAGSSVQGVNVPVVDNTMTDVKVWVRSELSGANLGEASTDGPFVVGEYVAVPLNEAVTISSSGVFVGYSFVGGTSTAYPIATDYEDEPVENSLFLQYNASGWGDYSLGYGPSTLQALLANLQLPDYSISLTTVGQSAQMPNSTYSIPVTFGSNSAKAIQSLDVDVTVEGKTQNKHIVLDAPVESGLLKTGSFTFTGTSPAKTGRYDLTLAVKKVNGETYADQAQATTQLKNLTRLVERRTVIEEFTGTGCGWCPRGWVGMEYMKENYPDNFIGIAFHKYNQSDPLYLANYPDLGLTSAPGCVIDRKESADPYYGNTDYNLGIELDFERLNAQAPEVDVRVSALWNETQTQVNIEADIEFLIAPQDVSLVYVLTADSLSGTTSAWRQSNYYYQYTAAQFGNAPGISDFCSGGQYGSSSVLLTFNDALIGSSYASATKNNGPTITATDGYQAGSTYQGSYTISQPSSTAVRNVLRKDLVTAIVLVVDNQTGEVLNAGKSRVHPADYDAISPLTSSTNAGATERYNAAGLRLTAPQRGLNLIRMSDGTVKKVLVK